MSTIHRHLLQAALAGACLLASVSSQAQAGAPAGDPARWYVDDATAQEQLRTLRKEIGAALQEAQAACRALPAAERPACVKQARATYQQDMAHAQQQRAATHPQH
ncbi:hypothetical protein AAKU55_001830 [Oxalobacteraceae bacterium GrIS 1.11]